MRLFGKPKPAAPVPRDAIQHLRETIETLEKREKFLEKKMEAELETAKRLVSKNKKGAMLALKRKKLYEAQIEKLTGARMTLETQVLTIEGSTVNLQAFNAMAQGAASMRAIHGQMNIDRVDAIMDDVREQMDLASEVAGVISEPLGNNDIDEDELNAQLEELEQEELDAKLLDVQNVPTTSLPNVPTTELPTPAAAAPSKQKASRVRDEDEDELEQLRQAMAN
ncbi:hypothetical protein CAOG_03797 [Capsaspora owczarzaki ATCC 30864]|uniref:Uncharacterized protein n=1 Tax=Capsaspora owczarzaki (strain ATCC 30864) TaxID=595528 RepID=A0A0D2WNT8_CAPO3|nr:hypothetical protein CAOG_03797 [Capsaspora owczarzaki ATCC 30864]KJE92915.1 hypothetical protein CAOG_003797 [Capsaspora owczarzaki ATCC 30864]|eukprot:XP_004363525.1 hypothetical protein CAOG_03797 [Capsaspora owczarzaki ATCC 30864]